LLTICLHQVFLFFLYFFRFFFGFFGLWMNFFLKQFFILISKLFYTWETYLYVTKKKDRNKAWIAKLRSIYFNEVSEIFDIEIKAYLDPNREEKYKYTFFLIKWGRYIYAFLISIINFVMDYSKENYRRRLLYYKKIRESWEDYSPIITCYFYVPMYFLIKKFVRLNIYWVFPFLYVGIFYSRIKSFFIVLYETIILKKKIFKTRRWFLKSVPVRLSLLVVFGMENDKKKIIEQTKYDDRSLLVRYFIFLLYMLNITDNKYLTYKKKYFQFKYDQAIYDSKNIHIYFFFYVKLLKILYYIWCFIYFHVTLLEWYFIATCFFVVSKTIKYIRFFINFLRFLYGSILRICRSLKFFFFVVYLFFKKHG
jgi:hypothetical protein